MHVSMTENVGVREKSHVFKQTSRQTDTQVHMYETSTGIALAKYNLARQKTEDIKRQLNYEG